MTTTPARYHHGNLRAALVIAGVDAARELGPDGLALRDLARRVGVSHNAAYRHFADREDLLAEVAAVAMAELTEAGEVALATVTDTDPVRRARRRLTELGRNYVAFARHHAGLFRVAFAAHPSLADDSASAASDHESLAEAGPFGQLNACLDDLVAVGYLAADARPGAEYTCWASVHGMAMLLLEGPIQGLPEELADQVIDQMLQAIDRSYGATTGQHTPM